MAYTLIPSNVIITNTTQPVQTRKGICFDSGASCRLIGEAQCNDYQQVLKTELHSGKGPRSQKYGTGMHQSQKCLMT